MVILVSLLPFKLVSTAVLPDVAELKDMVRALILDKKNQTSAPVKAVEQSCVTCGGGHSYQNCPATDGNIYRDNIQETPGFLPFKHKENKSKQFQSGKQLQSKPREQFQPKPNLPSPGSRTLLGNTITNPKEDLKGITTRSGVAYQGPAIYFVLISPPKYESVYTGGGYKGLMAPTNNGKHEDVQPLVIQVQSQNPTSEPVVDPVSAPMPNQRTSIPFPSSEKANDQIEKFYEIFKRFELVNAYGCLDLMPKIARL
ncbi:hypothetical protein Tco_0801661 [Tanacetum coccineum]|uniref:Reverse transcriptase domain-containing protein n=1 Tax=Tanacetum coccineum TaxID=301880 RepID=A0ABQ4ZWU3_9ASTR